MASKQVIGAIIGIEGATQYIKTLGQISQSTKALQSEMKALTSSFDDNGKTVSQLKAQKETLQKIIDSENDKLYHQQKMLDDVNKAASDVKVTDEKWAKAQQQVATDVNNTTARINELNQEMERLKEQNGLTLFVDAWKQASSKTGEAIKEIGGAMTKYITVPIVAGMGASVKVATDFESAFTGVTKTVDGTKEELAQLREELLKIPLETASSAEEVMAVAEAAGQLGIKVDDIANFTKNIIMLGDSTNIAADEGATSIAQFLNIVGDAPTTVEMFGSALVELGNNTATDEASILALSTRLASAGHLVGLTTPEILGLSAAMSSVGLTAEAGGTAMSTTMKMISKAVAEGSDDLALYGEITGRTAEEFAQLWREKPIDALQEFLKGLANLDGGSEELILMLDELGFAGIRQSDTLQRLALDYDGVTEAVEMATAAYKTNEESLDGQNKLTEEANRRYGDFASQISQMKESFKIFASDVGGTIKDLLLPIIENLSNAFVKLHEWWTGLSPDVKNFIVVLGGVVAAIGPVLMAVGQALIFAAKFKQALGVLEIGITGLASPIGIAIAAVVALSFAIAEIITHWDEISAFFKNIGEVVTSTGQLIWELIKVAADIWVRSVKGILEGVLYLLMNVLNTIAMTIRTALQNLSLLIQTVFNTIKGLVTALFQFLKGDTQGAINTLRATFVSAFGNLLQMFRNCWDNLKSIWNGIISSARSWGRDLMDSLIGGITSKMGAVAEAARNAASKISAFLHFSEPDEGPLSNFHTFMPDMMKQMAQGIYDNSYLVEDALSNLTNGMSTQLNGGYTTNYGGVIINLNVPQGANGQQLVEEIETELANRTMRRKAVFG